MYRCRFQFQQLEGNLQDKKNMMQKAPFETKYSQNHQRHWEDTVIGVHSLQIPANSNKLLYAHAEFYTSTLFI